MPFCFNVKPWLTWLQACRMAVELGLNKYVAHPPLNESDFQKLERRNRERTYLVLFIHDRSLSTQTGRHWMLPEGDLVKHSTTWHTGGIKGPRPEDVIIAAFVQLRLIAVGHAVTFVSNRAPSDHLSIRPRQRKSLRVTRATPISIMKSFCGTATAS